MRPKVNTKTPLALSHKLDIKPMSVNEAYQGRKFKTKKYNKWSDDVHLLLPSWAGNIMDKKLELYVKFGFSTMASDIDNGLKTLMDALSKKYRFNDKYIMRLVVDKTLVPKGEEFIFFTLNILEE